MSMRLRITSLLASLLVLPLALIGSVSRPHALASSMPEGMTNMTSSQLGDCLSACASQLQNTVSAINQREVDKEKEPNPRPAELYYLQFLKFAPYVALISAAYLLRYLRLRPPDLVLLYGTYRT